MFRCPNSLTDMFIQRSLYTIFIYLFILATLSVVTFAYVASLHNPNDAVNKLHDKHYENGHHDEHVDHQSVLGSKKEAEEFDKLSPEESKRRLRILATKMDVDKDGFVDRHELSNWIFNSLEKLDREETDERFEEVDENGDQQVTWEEYKNDAFGDDADEVDVDDEKLMEEDLRYFQAADRDHDGKLNKDEFAAFQNPENHEHMHLTLVENTLKEKDVNKDGLIDLTEFLGNYANKKDSEWYTIETSRFKEDYDKNNDGVLDRQEMKTWLVPNMSETAKEETDHLFSEADHNKDDKLSYVEIEQEYNLFVGSEATNYGEHLEDLLHDEL